MSYQTRFFWISNSVPWTCGKGNQLQSGIGVKQLCPSHNSFTDRSPNNQDKKQTSHCSLFQPFGLYERLVSKFMLKLLAFDDLLKLIAFQNYKQVAYLLSRLWKGTAYVCRQTRLWLILSLLWVSNWWPFVDDKFYWILYSVFRVYVINSKEDEVFPTNICVQL